MSNTFKPPPFAAEAVRRGSVATVAVRGELDIATTPQLQAALARLEPGYDTLVIDLSQCSFFASSGISLLLDENEKAARERVELVVVKAPPNVQRMFDLAGLDDRFTFVERAPE